MSQTPMNENERELISASMDNELSAEERAVVAELLKRDDAREYLRQLESARALVTSHGVEEAPAGVARAVAAATGKPAVVHQLNAVSWRSAVFAVAAALLAALGVMFGPVLFKPTPISPPGIARETLGERQQDEIQAWAEDGSEALPKDAAAELADDRLRTQMGAQEEPASDAAEPAREIEKTGRVADSGVAGGLGGGAVRRGGAPSSQSEYERKAESEDARAESGSRDNDEALPGMVQRRARGNAPAPQGRADAAPHLLLELRTERRLAAQADVLWVAGLHGKAALSPEQEFADVLVDLPESAVEGLRLALQRLAGDQRFGAVVPALETADETNARGIDRYLPARAEGLNDANAADVRVVIRIR